MNISKHSKKEDIHFICEELNYIEPYWLDIHEENEVIGIVTGYRMNIPLLLNDLLTEEYSFIEFDELSELCTYLWSFLSQCKLDLLSGRSGYLCFINNVHIFGSTPSYSKELELFELLEKKNEVLIYSPGTTEIYDDYVNEERDEYYWSEHIVRLMDKGWVNDEDFNFLIKTTPHKRPRKYYDVNETTITTAPYEHWIKSKGISWIQSLWKANIKQSRYKEVFDEIRLSQNKLDKRIYFDVVSFLNKLSITDFQQNLLENPFTTDTYLRHEGVFAHYNDQKYLITYSLFYKENTQHEHPYEDIKISYCSSDIDGSIKRSGRMDENTKNSLAILFSDFFNRLYAQYQAETNINEKDMSLFKAALIKPHLYIYPPVLYYLNKDN